MAEFHPTPAQRLAVEHRGGSLLVSAAAGSGKTRVLIERIVSLLTDPEDPADIDELLIVTYTRAAAAQLRTRIFERLQQRVAQEPSNRRLRRQMNLCLHAPIGTIDSYCVGLLRENCRLLGLAPDFCVCEEERAQAIRETVLERVLDRVYENLNDDGLRVLIDTVGAGRDDRRLAELVLSLHTKLRSHLDPEAWAGRLLAQMRASEDASQTPWGREVLDGVASDAAFWHGQMQRLLGQMLAEDGPVKKAYYDSVAQTSDALQALALAAASGWDAARAAAVIPFPRLGSLRKPPDPAFSEQIKLCRETCKRACAKLTAIFSDSEETVLADMAQTAPAMQALLHLTLDFDAAYTREKRRRNLLDFADLEHLTARLLAEPDGTLTWAAQEQAARFREIFVDEYQDVSRLQDFLCRALSRQGENLFLVGDVKQSIYRFRLAEPAVFTEKYVRFADVADCGARPGPWQPVAERTVPDGLTGGRVLLRENFRSRASVLDAVNQVFCNIMSTDLGELTYDEAAQMRCGRSDGAGGETPELILLTPPEDTGEDEETPDKLRLEAEWVAGRVRQLVEGGQVLVPDGDGVRPLRYDDVAILLRSANTVGPVYRRALVRAGVPLANGPTGGFFASTEVSVMLSLLAVIDNPRQDVPLISVLRSPFFAFTADELADIRACDRQGDFYTALTKAAQKGGKCADFLALLSRLRRLAPEMETGAFVRHVCVSLNLEAMCCAMRDGPARRENLTLFTECAERFAATGGQGLRRFVQWLRRLAERGEEPSGAGSGIGGVNVMSIHRSKGLEFAVVFLCDTARRFNKSDLRAAVLVHPELGLGPKVTDTEHGVEYPTLARRAIAARLEKETLSEEMRVLYVAMTRARERLYITGVVADPEKKLASLWGEHPAAPQLLRAASSPVDWLLRAAGAGDALKVRVVCADATGQGQSDAAVQPAKAAAPSPQVLESLCERLNYAYPHAQAVRLPSKLTATGIERAEQEDPEAAVLPMGKVRCEFPLPDFLRAQRPASAAERGTAAHRLLQCMDLARGAREGAASERDRLLAEGCLTPREAEIADVEAVDRFLASPLCRRVLAADTVRREFRFSLLCPAGDFYPGADGEEILLQGVVDCCIEEAGMLTVIDYKTDAVYGAALAERAQQYRAQVRAYCAAMARITGLPVREAVLYFLTAGQAIAVSPA